MNNNFIQLNAEKIILEYKLDKIRKFIENRLTIVDSITKNELTVILNMIKQYEKVPQNFELTKPLVENISEEDHNNVQQ